VLERLREEEVGVGRAGHEHRRRGRHRHARDQPARTAADALPGRRPQLTLCAQREVRAA
jgi:hypothetical protein